MSVVPAIRRIRPLGEAERGHLPVWLGLVLRLAGWVACELRVRREARKLATCDDHLLRDIGVARSDIEGAVRWGRDVTDWR